jgi:hypothetical protein
MSDIGNIGLTLHLVLLTVAFPALITLLALWRTVQCRGPARLWALTALIVAPLPLIFIFGDARPGAMGDRYMSALEDAVRRFGWLVYVMPMSLPLLISGMVRGRRAPWVDVLHLGALAALAALWMLGT